MSSPNTRSISISRETRDQLEEISEARGGVSLSSLVEELIAPDLGLAVVPATPRLRYLGGVPFRERSGRHRK